MHRNSEHLIFSRLTLVHSGFLLGHSGGLPLGSTIEIKFSNMRSTSWQAVNNEQFSNWDRQYLLMKAPEDLGSCTKCEKLGKLVELRGWGLPAKLSSIRRIKNHK